MRFFQYLYFVIFITVLGFSGVWGCHTTGRASSSSSMRAQARSLQHVQTPGNTKVQVATLTPVLRPSVVNATALRAPSERRNVSKKKKKYTLKELLTLAWRRSPTLREAQYQLKSFQARKSEAIWSSWWPQGSIVAVVAPGPPARGDALKTTTPYPEAYSRISEYGVLTRVEMSLVLPLYTFGKLTLLQNAASHGVRLGEAKILLEKGKWDVLVKKAFYGLQFAESSLVLIDEAEEQITGAKKKVKGKTDRLKIQVIEAQVGGRRVQAETVKRLTESALARLTGLPLDSPIALAKPELEEVKIHVQQLAHYQRMAQLHRPEIQILAHAVNAKRAILNAQRRTWLPDFFLAGFFRWGYNSAADDQLSPFARDDFNFLEGGVLLGVRWSLDIPITVAKIHRAEADFEAFRSRRRLALQGIALQVEKRFRELKAAQKMLVIQKKGKKAASRWMTRTMIAFRSGLTEVKDVSDALLAFAQTQFAYLEAMYKVKLSAALLSRAVGLDVTRLKKAAVTLKKRSKKQ